MQQEKRLQINHIKPQTSLLKQYSSELTPFLNNKHCRNIKGTLHFVAYSLQNGTDLPLATIKRSNTKNLRKEKRKAWQSKPIFKIKSPQQISQKAQRKILQAKLSKQINDQNNLIKVKKPNVPLYFQKKKRSQKRRRQYKALLIKAYKHQLFRFFGCIIYSRGWRIGTQQLKDKLGYSDDFFEEQYLRKIMKIRQAQQIIFLHNRAFRYSLRTIRLICFPIKKHKNTKKPIMIPQKRSQIQYERKKQHEDRLKHKKIKGDIYKRQRRRKMRRQKLYVPNHKTHLKLNMKKRQCSIIRHPAENQPIDEE